jgi:hypothetical protein
MIKFLRQCGSGRGVLDGYLDFSDRFYVLCLKFVVGFGVCEISVARLPVCVLTEFVRASPREIELQFSRYVIDGSG